MAARFNKETVARWKAQAETYVGLHDMGLEDIRSALDAWAVARNCGITEEAYQDRKVHDGHIKTALEKIFPNALFLDRY
jgi:hypothetical protein